MTGRPRKVEVAQERRRRSAGTLDRMQQMKLSVPDKVREEYPDHEFCWINDSGTRMYDKTERDDWSKVDGVQPIPVGVDKFNQPIQAHLCRKPREFIEADKREKLAAISEQEKSILQGQRAPEDQTAVAGTASYVPEGNRINQGYTP